MQADRGGGRARGAGELLRQQHLVNIITPVVQAVNGANATLQCRILGNPPPAVKWVLNGRVIKNRSAPLTAKPGQIYLIQSVATMEGMWKKQSNNIAKGTTDPRVEFILQK